MKTFSDLKRDLTIGTKLTMIKSALPNNKLLNIEREICATQTNGISLKTENKSGKSFLEYPPASLVDYDGEIITFYKPALRDLTPDEKAIIDNTPSHREENKQQALNDMMTDSSGTYWMDKRYFSENDAEWRWNWSKGLKWDINDNKMFDKKIKGEIDLQYIIKK